MPPTLLEILRKTEVFFTKAGLENPRLDAEWLLAHVLGCRRLDLYLRFEEPLDEVVLAQLRPLVGRRARREPLQYVVGMTPFADLVLKTDRRALVPRPETEQLAEDLIMEGKERPPRRILDLGTGTGALALALAQGFAVATVIAADISGEALELARENADRNGLEGRVRWVLSDWFSAIDEGHFDWIVSNPPYLTEAEWAQATPEVREFEPRNALVSADDGAGDLERIIEGGWERLAAGGLLVCETGIAHHARLEQCAQALGYEAIESRPDLSGRPRFFRARKPVPAVPR